MRVTRSKKSRYFLQQTVRTIGTGATACPTAIKGGPAAHCLGITLSFLPQTDGATAFPAFDDCVTGETA